ncbi:MAG: hotdog fold thioesterase [Cyanobacteria bacterium RYN_339]|nr:hotdog fold thioesterase [Cyanobacteria bacterium RYN_339]
MDPRIDLLRKRQAVTLMHTLGMELVAGTRDCVKGTMPVTPAVHQPFGLLHGGASVALAETLASIGAWLNLDIEREMAVGLEINANHVRAVTAGVVTGTATPLHVGKRTQIWEVRIEDERGKLVCISRCTLAVVPLPG